MEFNKAYVSIVSFNSLIISLNNLDYSSPLEVGTQTWYDGRLRIWIAGYYFNGVNSQLDTLPENFGDLNDLRILYLEWNNLGVLGRIYLSDEGINAQISIHSFVRKINSTQHP